MYNKCDGTCSLNINKMHLINNLLTYRVPFATGQHSFKLITLLVSSRQILYCQAFSWCVAILLKFKVFNSKFKLNA